MAPGQAPNPVFEPGQRLVGDASPRLRLVRDREAKERALPRPGHGTLLRVDLKLEAPFDEASEARHHPNPGLLAADIDVAVVRIAHKSMPTALKLAIQFVQHEIREQRRKRSALRRTLPASLEHPLVAHHRTQRRFYVLGITDRLH